MRYAPAVLALVALTGCVAAGGRPRIVAPELTPAEQSVVETLADQVERIARRQGVPSPPLYIGVNPTQALRISHAQYNFADRSLYLDRALLSLPAARRDWIIAHEMAHYILGHDRSPKPTEQKELEAEALALELVAELSGQDRQALGAERLRWYGQAAERGAPTVRGHYPLCVEARELARAWRLEPPQACR